MPVQASNRLFKLSILPYGQAGGLSVRLQAGGLPYGQAEGLLSVRYRLVVLQDRLVVPRDKLS